MSSVQLQNSTNFFNQGVATLNGVDLTLLRQNVTALSLATANLQRPVAPAVKVDLEQRIHSLQNQIAQQQALVESNQASVELATRQLKALSNDLKGMNRSVLQSESNYFWAATSYLKFGYLAIARSCSYVYNHPGRVLGAAAVLGAGTAYALRK